MSTIAPGARNGHRMGPTPGQKPYKITHEGKVIHRQTGRKLGNVRKTRIPFGPTDNIRMETRWEARPPGQALTVSAMGTFGAHKTRQEAAEKLYYG